ncbi:MAG: CpXC domain-containing protein [Dehalococcoidia bacterium]|nr:CpXC domain-containing protein [Dehalococcoidia bacterium]
MEQKTVVEIECPKCGSSGKASVKVFIDAQSDPRGRKNLLAGKLNRYRCRGCGFTDSVPAGVIYHDPEKRFCVQYVPRWLTEQDEFLDQLDEAARPVIFEDESWGGIPAYLRDVHVVLSLSELANYVVFRERLWKRRVSSVQGLVVCFCCDRSIEHGERYFCVSRVVRERGSGRLQEDRIVDSTASLQVCADCRKKAGSGPVSFSYAPLPLLHLEQEGFRRFAAQHGNWESLRRQDSPCGDACTLCGTAPAPGRKYVTIELSEETYSPEGAQTIAVHAELATLCGPCSERYLVWLSLEDDSGQQAAESRAG